MMNENLREVVHYLSIKYDFPEEEAIEHIGLINIVNQTSSRSSATASAASAAGVACSISKTTTHSQGKRDAKRNVLLLELQNTYGYDTQLLHNSSIGDIREIIKKQIKEQKNKTKKDKKQKNQKKNLNDIITQSPPCEVQVQIQEEEQVQEQVQEQELKRDCSDSEYESEEEEEICVSEFKHKGITYLKDDKNNTLFDTETCDEIGTWDEKKKEIRLHDQEKYSYDSDMN